MKWHAVQKYWTKHFLEINFMHKNLTFCTNLSSGRAFTPSIATDIVGLLPKHLCNVSDTCCCCETISSFFLFITIPTKHSSGFAEGKQLYPTAYINRQKSFMVYKCNRVIFWEFLI